MPISCHPANWREWLDISQARMADAEALQQNPTSHLAAAYMAGYAIESALKAYYARLGKPYKAFGKEGHDLRLLWKESGLRLSDLGDAHGVGGFFLEEWSTDIRYCQEIDPGHGADALIQGAKQLCGSLQNHIKRYRGRGRS